VGNTNEFTILELAQKVVALTGAKSGIVRKPLPSDDPVQRKPDTSLARANLGGWQATTALDEGLKRTIAYFREVVSAA
jgi:UDP-glucuronate decarboxylase